MSPTRPSEESKFCVKERREVLISVGWATLKALSFFSYDKQNQLLDRGAFPGYSQHCAMRKKFIEQEVIQAIHNGAKQVIIPGAGYDSLALRLHKIYPDVTFIELDRGHTRDTKLEAIKSLKNNSNSAIAKFGEIGDNLEFMECDLSKPDWHDKLGTNPKFDKTKKTVVVAEGFTMYLTEAEVIKFLQSLMLRFILDCA